MSKLGNLTGVSSTSMTLSMESAAHMVPRSEAQTRVDQALANLVAGLVHAESLLAVQQERVSAGTKIRVRNYKKVIRAVASGRLNGAEEIQRALRVRFERASTGFWSRIGDAFRRDTVFAVGDFMQGARLDQVVSSLQTTFKLAAAQIHKVMPKELGTEPLEISEELKRCVDAGTTGPADETAWRIDARLWLSQAAKHEESPFLKKMAADIDAVLQLDAITTQESAAQIEKWMILQKTRNSWTQQEFGDSVDALIKSLTDSGADLTAENRLQIELVAGMALAVSKRLQPARARQERSGARVSTAQEDLATAFSSISNKLHSSGLSRGDAAKVVTAFRALLDMQGCTSPLLQPAEVPCRVLHLDNDLTAILATEVPLKALKASLVEAGLRDSCRQLIDRLDHAQLTVQEQANWRMRREDALQILERAKGFGEYKTVLLNNWSLRKSDKVDDEKLMLFNHTMNDLRTLLGDQYLAKASGSLGKARDALQAVLTPVEPKFLKTIAEQIGDKVTVVARQLAALETELAHEAHKFFARGECPTHDATHLPLVDLQAEIGKITATKALYAHYGVSEEVNLQGLCKAAKGSDGVAAAYLAQYCQAWAQKVGELGKLHHIRSVQARMIRAAEQLRNQDAKVRAKAVGYLQWMGAGRLAAHVHDTTVQALGVLEQYIQDKGLVQNLESKKQELRWARVTDIAEDKGGDAGDQLSLTAHPDLATMDLSSWEDRNAQAATDATIAALDATDPATAAASTQGTTSAQTEAAAATSRIHQQRSLGRVALSLLTGLLRLVVIRLPRLIGRVAVLIWRRALRPFGVHVLAPMWKKALWPALKVVGMGMFWALYGLTFPIIWLGKLLLRGAEKTVSATNAVVEGAEKLATAAS